jgi:NAD(P)H-flavin reductase
MGLSSAVLYNTRLIEFSIWIHIVVQRRGSAVDIATGYEVGDRRVRVRVPVGASFYFLNVVQTGSAAHPASY